MDPELKEYLDKRFDAVDWRLAELLDGGQSRPASRDQSLQELEQDHEPALTAALANLRR